LPSLNTLDINSGSLETIFKIYKKTLPKLPDYLTLHGKINFKYAEEIFKELANNELFNLRKMLRGLEDQITQNKIKNDIIQRERKQAGFTKNLITKKEKKLLKLKQLEKHEVDKFKKEKINKKIETHKKSYYDILNKYDREGNFEEDSELFSKSEYYKNTFTVSESDVVPDLSSSDIDKKQEKCYYRLSEKKEKRDKKVEKKTESNKVIEKVDTTSADTQSNPTSQSTQNDLNNNNDSINLNKGMLDLFEADEKPKKKIILKKKENIKENVGDKGDSKGIHKKEKVDSNKILPKTEESNNNNSRSNFTQNNNSTNNSNTNNGNNNNYFLNIYEDEINLNRLMQSNSKYLKYVKVRILYFIH